MQIQKLILGDGDYEGEVKDGVPNGKGKLVKGADQWYEGDFLDGKKHGKGTLFLPNRDLISGSFVNGNPEGEVVWNYKDMHRRSGFLSAGKFNGPSTMHLQNGDTWHEIWTNGVIICRRVEKALVNIGEKITILDYLTLEPEMKVIYSSQQGRSQKLLSEKYAGVMSDKRMWDKTNEGYYIGDVKDGKPHGNGILLYSQDPNDIYMKENSLTAKDLEWELFTI